MISTIDRACNIHMLQIQISSYRMRCAFAATTRVSVSRVRSICSMCILLARYVEQYACRMHADFHARALSIWSVESDVTAMHVSVHCMQAKSMRACCGEFNAF